MLAKHGADTEVGVACVSKLAWGGGHGVEGQNVCGQLQLFRQEERNNRAKSFGMTF